MAYCTVLRRKWGRGVLEYAIGVEDKGHNGKQSRNEVVSCVNLHPTRSFAKQMKKYWMRAKKGHTCQVLHVIQSFSKEEFDPERKEDLFLANRVGFTFAQKYYPNRQVAIFTQIDGKGGYVHNHIVINDVSMDTYKGCDKNQYHFTTVKEWTNECTEMYTVLDSGKKNPEKLTQTERVKREKGEYSWKDDLRERIKASLLHSTDINEFKNMLSKNGVDIVFKNTKGHGSHFVYELKDLSHVPKGTKKPKHTKMRSYNLGYEYDDAFVSNYFEKRKINSLYEAERLTKESEEKMRSDEPEKRFIPKMGVKEYLQSEGIDFETDENGEIVSVSGSYNEIYGGYCYYLSRQYQELVEDEIEEENEEEVRDSRRKQKGRVIEEPVTVYGEYTYEGETQFATTIPEEPLIIQRPVIEEPVQEAQAENVFEIPEEIIVRPSGEILQEESVVDMPVQKPAENHPEDEKVREMRKRDEHRAAVIAADAERARSKLKERIRGEKTAHRRSGFEDIFESWAKEKSNDKQYGE